MDLSKSLAWPCVALATLSLARAGDAQSDRLPGRWAGPTVVDPELRGIQARSDGDLFIGLKFEPGPGEPDLVFANPVRDFAVGEYPDGAFVVLAGGLRDSLDLYEFDPASGTIDRFETHGGRRLPQQGFGEGLGSWPLREDRDLCVFAFEMDGRVHARVWGDARVLASQVLPLTVEGFDVSLDERRQLVRVAFRGAPEARPLEFVHPLAPRMTLPGLVRRAITMPATRVGRPSRSVVTFRNAGARPLAARLSFSGAGFALAVPAGLAPVDDLTLAPGESTAREIVLRAEGPGEFAARLRIESPVSTVRGEIVLQGRVEAPPGARAAAAPQTVRPEVGSRVEPEPEPERPPVAAPAFGPLAALERGELVELELDRVDAAVLRVRGRLAPGRVLARGGAAPKIRLRNGRRSLERPADGRFEFMIRAAAGDRVRLSLVDPWTADPPELELDPIAPALLPDGRDIVVCGRRDARFLLLACADRAGSTVLRRWRGRTDARGIARLPRTMFGRGRSPVWLAVIVLGFDGDALRSDLLELLPPT